MEKQELAAFVEWLPSNVEEFKDKNPEEVVTMLNELSQTDEGVNVISNLINQFKERTQMFEQGGKLSFLVEKLKNGNKYNRQQAIQNKEDAGLYYTDENTGQRLRGPIDKGNLKAKTAKAKAVDGYQDQEFITDFDRKDYRARKQALKQTNPELSRRERKAEALLAHPVTNPTINPGNVGEIGYQKIVFNRPRNGVVEVGNITSEVIPNPIKRPTTTNPTTDPVSKPVDTETPSTNNRLNWNEFANAIETKLRNSGSFRAGMDYATLQALMEDEYRNYYNNPDTYKFDSMTAPVFDRYRNRRLTMPAPIYRAGYGDFDTDRSYLFNDGDLGAVPNSPKYEAMTKGISYPIMASIAATAAAPAVIQGARDAIGYAGQMLKNAQTSGYYPRQIVQRPSNPARVRLPNGQYTQRPAQELYRGPRGRYVAPYQVPNFFFKTGGEISKFDNGGKQRRSDQFRKEFHGVDLFKYGPNSRQRVNNTFDGTSIPSGSNSETLPNGVGIRQISNKNITTTELVSPDKKDTLYIHNGVAGRVDSNIDDSGILGFFGLKKSSPVSDRYKFLQKVFKSHKF